MTPSWNDLLFWKGEKWRTLRHILKEYPQEIQPEPRLVFRPLIQTPLETVRVVMVFPHPHLVEGAADGLALSHKHPDKTPFVFASFMEELVQGLGVKPRRTDLSKWCQQGVLLWNACPTMLGGLPSSHNNLGWAELTREIIETAYLQNSKTVFVFCGTHNLAEHLPEDATKIFLPVPVYGPRNPFYGCRVFNQINALMKKSNQRKINWAV